MSCSKHSLTPDEPETAKRSKQIVRETDRDLFELLPVFASEEGRHGVVRIVPRKLDSKLTRPDIPNIVLVMDRSGSMNWGGRIEEAKAAISYFCKLCREDLAQKARVSIVVFNHMADGILSRAINPSEEEIDRACAGIKAKFGTDFKEGLTEAVRTLSDTEVVPPDSFNMILFFTDGEDGSSLRDEMTEHAMGNKSALLNSLQQKRLVLHTFGIGGDVSMGLLQQMAALPRHKGEATQLSTPDLMRKAMGVAAALMHQCVAGEVTLVLKDGAGAVLDRIQVMELQTGLEAKVGFVSGAKPRTFALEIDGEEVASVSNEEFQVDPGCSDDAVKGFETATVNQIAQKVVEDHDLEAAIKEVQDRLLLLTTAVPNARTDSLTSLMQKVEQISVNDRTLSREQTWLPVIHLAANNAAQARLHSGAEAMVPTEGRVMSNVARTNSGV